MIALDESNLCGRKEMSEKKKILTRKEHVSDENVLGGNFPRRKCSIKMCALRKFLVGKFSVEKNN